MPFYTKKVVGFFSCGLLILFYVSHRAWESSLSCGIRRYAFGLLTETLAGIANDFSYLMHHYHHFHSSAGLCTVHCFSFKDLEHLQTLTGVINRPLK